jgi:hypothetical protein
MLVGFAGVGIMAYRWKSKPALIALRSRLARLCCGVLEGVISAVGIFETCRSGVTMSVCRGDRKSMAEGPNGANDRS